jgi:hypothetical protein
VVYPIGHYTYRKNEPEKNIWKCCKNMSMKNSPNFISLRDISLEKIVMHGRHVTMVMKNKKWKIKITGKLFTIFFTIAEPALESGHEYTSKAEKLSQ